MPNLLVVDSDIQLTERLRAAWQPLHRVQACATEAEALSVLGPQRIDLVIAEYHLPDGSGLDLLRRIKGTFPALPVIMLTAFGSEWTCASALKLGVRDYFIKPCDPSTIDRSIRSILRVAACRGESRENALIGRGEAPDTGDRLVSSSRESGIEQVVRFIHEHYWENISLTQSACRAGMNKFALSRTFRAHMGVSFRCYLQRVRVQKARELLLGPKYSITEIAQMVGFGDLPRFDKVFKRLEGTSPSIYRALSASHSAPSGATIGKVPLVSDRRGASNGDTRSINH